MPKSVWDTGLAEIRQDNRSGSAEIESRALGLLIGAIGDRLPDCTVQHYRRELLRLSRELVAAQPAMAAVFGLVNDMLWASDPATHAEEMRQRALAFLQERQICSQQQLTDVAERAAGHLGQYSTLMTYSRSSTVEHALVLWAERKRRERSRPRLYCSEARPMLEGQTLASEMAWAGLEVTVGIDMALFGWLPETEALVVGADSLSVHGLVNKLGTAPLVRAAEIQGIPRIVLGTSSKFLPSDYVLQQALRSRNSGEIMPEPDDRHLSVSNVYFDITSLTSVSMVIAESGILEHAELLVALDRVRTYPGLLGRRNVQ